MSEAPEKLFPARRDDLVATLAFALTRDSRLARMQSAELLASIVAERVVDQVVSEEIREVRIPRENVSHRCRADRVLSQATCCASYRCYA